MDLSPLLDLLACHSTPGDEDAVRDALRRHWDQAGWRVTEHGHYAISARPRQPERQKPTLLITAHMDSPGFFVERVKDQQLTLIRAGYPRLPQAQGRGLLKTSRGTFQVTMDKEMTGDKESFSAQYKGRAEVGDRVCHQPVARVVDDRYVLSPFLDNRVGCAMLALLAADPALQAELPVNLVLGATTTEEMGGFGAPVMAAEIAPDLAVCLDATYEFEEQDVRIGQGPVLTLSDASVIMSLSARDRIRKWFQRHDLPLQTESYNYSGTDARAFPHQGVRGTVLALLVPSAGNHTPVERCAVADLESLHRALTLMATHGIDALR